MRLEEIGNMFEDSVTRGNHRELVGAA